MLNRLFIAIGVLVILAIGAAFVVPRFVQWGDYRGRLESMAGDVFGAPVAITGDIQLTLLPQPRIVFAKVRVGSEGQPTMEVERVEAEFSLLDFLSDHYKVTRLQLEQPRVNISIGTDGALRSGFALSGAAGQSSVSIANADVVDGMINVTDARSGAHYAVNTITGQLRLETLQGPFSFQGSAGYLGAGYGVRASTAKFDAAGASTLSLYVKAADDSFTLESNGALQTGERPRYTGTLTYRRPPPKVAEGETADAGRGDFVLEGKVDAGSDRVVLSSYAVVPDENRAATRLTGAGELKLGEGMAFNAVISGGVITLPPRDATAELADPPYELVRLLAETPLPPIPGIPGTIGLDIAELNLRAVTLRNVRLDAMTDAHSWTITDFAAALPGATKVGLAGNLSIVDGRPIFAGGITLDSQQLDLLAQLWRKAPPGNPLFDMPGSLAADVALSSDTLTLSSGTLVVAGINQGFDAQIGFGAQRHLDLSAHLTTLGEAESAALGALLPDLGSGSSFGATFPKGSIDISASKAVLFGLEGSDLVAAANWEGGVLEFTKVSAGDLGGAAFDAKLTAFGTLAKPELSGVATLAVESDAPAFSQVMSAFGAPPSLQHFVALSLPARLSLQLDAPAGDGGQALKVDGRLGTSDAIFEAKLTAGVANSLTAPISAVLDLRSQSPRLMTAQLGLGETALFDDRTPLHLAVSVDGAPANAYQTRLTIEDGDDRISFAGDVVPGDFTRVGGDGTIEAKLSDPSVLADAIGAEGIYVPPISGKARLKFDGLDSLAFTDLEADGATGSLTLSRRDNRATLSGALKLPSLDARALLPLLAGGSGTVMGGGSVWPDGPIDIGAQPRTSEGRIDVTVQTLTAGGAPFATDVGFGYEWTAQDVRLRNLTATAGGGKIGLDAAVCCSSAGQPAKRVSGRLTLDGVDIDAVVPAALAEKLDGKIDASAGFDGTGTSVVEAIGAMTGSGSYTISGLSAAHFDPSIFSKAAALTGIVDMTPEALAAAIVEQLGQAPFAAAATTGSFTVAGGMLRSPNLAIAGEGARVFGFANLSLKDLVLDARYAMTPVAGGDVASPVDPTTAEVAALITGPLWAPRTDYDVGALVDGMKIKASEIELARLEQLRVEDEARQKAAAEEQARLAAEQAAADAAAKKAADEAAKKKAADAAAAAAATPADLGL